MKKILTVSLMAMMVVGAARADIASVGYVDEKLATKANASDVTSINAKIGTVADGKTLAGMIAEAKTEATYDDTEIRGMIAGKEDGLNKKNEIGEWTEVEEKQYFPSVFLTGQMIQSSTNEIGGLVADNAAAIKAINEGAVMNSGITADKVTAYEGYDARITANATAAAGAQAAAEAAQQTADAAQEVADKALEDAFEARDVAFQNGSAILRKVEQSSYNAKVAALEKADTDNLAEAKSYAEEKATAAEAAAIAAAAEAADAAYAAKAYETRVQANETAIAANTAAAAAAKSAADEAQADADANTQAIEKINIASAQLLTQGAGDGQYALTMTKSGDSLVYKWEMIGRYGK